MLDDAIEQTAGYLDKPEYGVVDDLGFLHLLSIKAGVINLPSSALLPSLVGVHLLLEFAGCIGSSLCKVFTIAGVDDAA